MDRVRESFADELLDGVDAVAIYRDQFLKDPTPAPT